MNQRQLSYFLEVYKQRSISAAAKSLFISPQGLSKTILSLEDELGVKLFIRGKNQITPTREAINLTSHAKAILSEYELITNKEFIKHTTRKNLHILGSYDVFQYFPVSFFYQFQNTYPEIGLSLIELPDFLILEQLDENEAELALLPGPLNSDKYHLDYLFTHQFRLIMNKNHPLAAKESITIADLKEQQLVIKAKNSPLSELHMNHFLSHSVETTILFEVTDSKVILQMAREALAIGMTLDYLIDKEDLDGLEIRSFSEQNFEKNMYLVQRKQTRCSNESSIFREYLLNWITQNEQAPHS